MIEKNKLNEIREHLENSQNPLFFFDNDVDGLCSFLILRRAIERGKGVAIKSFPDLNKQYLRKVNELNPDYVFILDKPRVSEEFIEGVCKKNLPLIWIDHHDVEIDERLLKKISYYNSCPSSEPTSYIAQKIFNRKEDIWLAMIGCIADVYIPEFSKDFAEKYPELLPTTNLSAFDILYTTELGKIIRIIDFGMKDTTTNLLNLIRILIKSTSPYDILEENPKTRHLHYQYNKINRIYKKLITKAESQANPEDKFIIFTYGGNMSISSEIANALFYKNQDKLIVVCYKNQRYGKVNVSIRGKNAKKITEKIVSKISGASGGGHEEATGAVIPEEKFEEFKKELKNYFFEASR